MYTNCLTLDIYDAIINKIAISINMNASGNKKSNKSWYAKSEKRINKILDATISIIALDGYHDFSLRNVANRVGCGLGGVQHFFPTKKELLKAALERDIQRYEEEMDNIAQAPNMPAKSKFTKLVRVHYAASMDPMVSGFFLSFWALCTHDKDALELQKDLYDNAVNRIAGVIIKLNPALSKADCLNRSILIISMLEGTVVLCGPNAKFNSKKNVVGKILIDNLLKICMD